MIHIVTVGRLGRTPVTPAVMRDDAKAVVKEEHHLGVPIVSAQWPAVREDDWLALAPVLEIDLCTVFGRYRAHVGCSSVLSDEGKGFTCRAVAFIVIAG